MHFITVYIHSVLDRTLMAGTAAERRGNGRITGGGKEDIKDILYMKVHEAGAREGSNGHAVDPAL